MSTECYGFTFEMATPSFICLETLSRSDLPRVCDQCFSSAWCGNVMLEATSSFANLEVSHDILEDEESSDDAK